MIPISQNFQIKIHSKQWPRLFLFFRNMKNARKIFIFITFSLLILPLIFPIVCLADQFKVIWVYDGDTVIAEGDDITIQVRLVGIDAPETSKKKGSPGQPYSQQAKKYLAGLVLNKVVHIKSCGLEGDNLILGAIYFNGRNINLEMLKAGLAEVYTGELPKGFDPQPYQQAEAGAKEAKVGIWSQLTDG